MNARTIRTLVTAVATAGIAIVTGCAVAPADGETTGSDALGATMYCEPNPPPNVNLSTKAATVTQRTLALSELPEGTYPPTGGNGHLTTAGSAGICAQGMINHGCTNAKLAYYGSPEEWVMATCPAGTMKSLLNWDYGTYTQYLGYTQVTVNGVATLAWFDGVDTSLFKGRIWYWNGSVWVWFKDTGSTTFTGYAYHVCTGGEADAYTDNNPYCYYTTTTCSTHCITAPAGQELDYEDPTACGTHCTQPPPPTPQ
jgi:hypothetical protein